MKLGFLCLIMLLKNLVMTLMLVSVYTYIYKGVQDWLNINLYYVIIVASAIGGDHFLGTFKHIFRLKDFSLKENILGVATKIFLAFFIGIIFEGMVIMSEPFNMFSVQTKGILRFLVFLHPAEGAIQSSSVITYGKFPPKWFVEEIVGLHSLKGLKKTISGKFLK